MQTHFWHPCHAADQQNFTDIRLVNFSVRQRLVTRGNCPFNQFSNQSFELGPGELQMKEKGRFTYASAFGTSTTRSSTLFTV
jgi:hypothetical protein